MRRRTICQMALLPFVLPLVGCNRAEEPYEPEFLETPIGRNGRELSFAVHPLHNPALLHQVFAPLIGYLNATAGGATFKLIASRDYAAFDRRLAAREFDFALPNPYQAVRAAAGGYRIFGKVAGDEDFRGLILTRRDSSIGAIGDLRGRTISYPAPTAVAATMLPQYFLHRNGVPLSATRPLYVGSMESTIRSLAVGTSDAAAIWPDPWNKFSRSDPGTAARLQVRWQTPPLVNNALVVRKSVPAELASRVLLALTRLGATAAGRALLDRLNVPGFEAADDRTYAPVRRFLREFSRTVRPLDLPEGLV